MAINSKAWEAVKKFMPTHYVGSTGPCCDHCSRALRIATEAIQSVPVDDPEMDGTDFAHTAWWRGNDQAFLVLVDQMSRKKYWELRNRT